jgi:hypothetical protein
MAAGLAGAGSVYDQWSALVGTESIQSWNLPLCYPLATGPRGYGGMRRIEGGAQLVGLWCRLVMSHWGLSLVHLIVLAQRLNRTKVLSG